MSTVRALLYADVRSLINFARDVRRSPGRAIFWVLFSLGIVGFGLLRFYRTSHHRPLPSTFSPQNTTDLIVCLGIILIGNTIATGSRSAGLFANAAEARFVISSPSPPFVATLYIQVRQLIKTSARTSIALAYAVLFYLPASIGTGTLARDLTLLVCVLVVVAAIPLPRALLAPGAGAVAGTLGVACMLAGSAPILRDVASAIRFPPPWNDLAMRIPNVHPGEILLHSSRAQGIAIGVMAGFTALILTAVARVATDSYPELYGLSINKIARAERLRGRRFGRSFAKPIVTHASSSVATPPGVWIFVWRAWTEYRRTTHWRLSLAEFAVVLGAGVAIGRLSLRVEPDLLLSLAGTAVNLLFILALSTSAGISTELRRPLFWLSGATLFERLCGLAAGQGLRAIAWSVLLAAGLLAGNAPLPAVIGVLLLGPAGQLLAIAIGYASYGALPYEADQRGPLMFFRMITGYVFVIPAVAAGIALTSFTSAILPGVLGAAATALLESGALVGFASWRLSRISVVPT